MKFSDRYANAVRSSNLRSEAKTTHSASDVLGAAGLAAKKQPLAMALQRLFVGDNRAALEIVELLAGMAVGKAFRQGHEIDRAQARDLGSAVLAWHRDGTCRPCNGLGHQRIANAPALSASKCPACRGTGKRLFDREFPMDRLDLARWLHAEIEREMQKAGPAAMASLAPSLDL